MRIVLTLSCLCFLVALFFTAPVFAASGQQHPGVGDPKPGGGECDWSAIKDSLYKTESSGSGGYTAVGPQTKYGRPLGKYQFIPPTQETFINKAKNCKGDSCRGRRILEERCWPVQECLMDALLADNLEKIKKNSACQQLLANGGKTIKGCGQGQCLTCKATESGLLAAYHLGGADECGKLLNGSGDKDNTGTSTGYYACKHGGKPVPGNCTPKDYGYTSEPGTSSPTLTAKQLEFAQQSGDSASINVSSDGLKYIWVAAFQMMTSQLSAIMMEQVAIIGSFFDAKHQLETQRLMQQKYAKAHKDYQPSEQLCEIGTFVRNLADSEERAKLTRHALTRAILDREVAAGDVKTMRLDSDEQTRLKLFVNKFCNKLSNTKQNDLLCTVDTKATQKDADVNYTNTIDLPLTLDIDFLKSGSTDKKATEDEENVFAMLDYIFMNDSFAWKEQGVTLNRSFYEPYMNVRSLIAMRTVAQDSFAYIISEKAKGPKDQEGQDGYSVAPFLKSLMLEMGIKNTDIEQAIGENPSYYAQMEILTKKIYQHPEFMANLYDKPANVKRLRAAMTAIKVMQDRDIHNALLRREMLMSMLLELQLRIDHKEDLSKGLGSVLSTRPDTTKESSGGDGPSDRSGLPH